MLWASLINNTTVICHTRHHPKAGNSELHNSVSSSFPAFYTQPKAQMNTSYKTPNNDSAICTYCGAHTPQQLTTPCFGCLIDAVGFVPPRWALAARHQPRPLLSVARFAEWVKLSAHILLYPFQVQDTIIKVREQVQQEIQALRARAGYKQPRPVNKSLVSDADSARAGLKELVHKIHTACLERSHGLCTFCSQPLTKPEVDTLLGVHIKHTDCGAFERAAFYTIAEHAGLLVACCYACNVEKGYAERVGMMVYQKYASGKMAIVEYSKKLQAEPPLFRIFDRHCFKYDFPPAAHTTAGPPAKRQAAYAAGIPYCVTLFEMRALRFRCAEPLDTPKRLNFLYWPECRVGEFTSARISPADRPFFVASFDWVPAPANSPEYLLRKKLDSVAARAESSAREQ